MGVRMRLVLLDADQVELAVVHAALGTQCIGELPHRRGRSAQDHRLQAMVVVEVGVVCAPGLGTLTHAELTAGALRSRGIEPAGLLLGSWPHEPDLAERCNRDDLPRVTGLPLLAVLPAGSGALSPADFVAAAPTWFTSPR